LNLPFMSHISAAPPGRLISHLFLSDHIQYIDSIYLSILLRFSDEKVAIADLSMLGWFKCRRGLCPQNTLTDWNRTGGLVFSSRARKMLPFA
jgi:hypothetical protein